MNELFNALAPAIGRAISALFEAGPLRGKVGFVVMVFPLSEEEAEHEIHYSSNVKWDDAVELMMSFIGRRMNKMNLSDETGGNG